MINEAKNSPNEEEANILQHYSDAVFAVMVKYISKSRYIKFYLFNVKVLMFTKKKKKKKSIYVN